MEKKRIVYIDFIKTVAIFIIITLHNGTWNTDFISNGSIASMIQYCARLFCEGVPIFVLLNGFLLFDRAFDAKKHMKRSAKLIIITVLWSFIMEIFYHLLEETPLSFESVLTGVLETSISNRHTGVLWFLQGLFVVYLIFPVLKYLYDTHEKLFNYLLLTVIISTYSVPLISLAYDAFQVGILNSMQVFISQYTLGIGINIYVVYFMLGGYIRKNWDRLPKKTLVLAGGICAVAACVIGILISCRAGVTYGANYNYSQIFLMFTVIGIILVCSKIPFNNKIINKGLAIVGDNTMGIYLIHRMVIEWMWKIQFPINTFILRLAMALTVFVISFAMTYIIRKIPKLSYLVKL